AIISKASPAADLSAIVPALSVWLVTHGYRVIVDRETGPHLKKAKSVPREKLGTYKPAFAIVLGGDGTMLSAARALARAAVPILGVNLGSLGFLTEVALADLYPALAAVVAGQAKTDARSLLTCELVRHGK